MLGAVPSLTLYWAYEHVFEMELAAVNTQMLAALSTTLVVPMLKSAVYSLAVDVV